MSKKMSTSAWALLILTVGLTVAWTPGNAAAQGTPWFTDVTSQAGLGGILGFRLSVADVNGDGYPDILAHLPQNDTTGDVRNKQLLYLNVADSANPGGRRFVDFTASSGIRANRQGTTAGRHSDAGIFADVDNDGDLDLFTGVYVHDNYTLDAGRNDLMLNDGQGHFQLAPNSPFHSEPIYNTAAEVFLDYNNDGNVDLFIGNWYKNGALTADQLYRGNGNGSFTNVTTSSGIGSATTAVYAVAAFDANGDGWTDLFAPAYSNTVAGSVPIQWRNNGNGTFTQVQGSTGYSPYRGYGTGRSSFGTMPRDYDGDGDPDFIEVITHGDGDGSNGVHSTVVTNSGGSWSWDFWRVSGRAADDNDLTHHGDHYASWFDFDNDGLVDFVLTECCYNAPSGGQNNRIYLFKQNPDRTFTNVTASSGLGVINAQAAPAHNVLPLDYDLDGDEDLLVGFASSTVGIQLWRNDVGTQNHWIVITLAGAGGAGRANRSAIGAKVEVTAGGITQTREVAAGNGHQGPQTPLSLTFGLGSATKVDYVRVRWPNQARTVTELFNVAANQFLGIEEVPGVSNPFSYGTVRDQQLACYGIARWSSADCSGISDFNDKQMCSGVAGSSQTPCTQITDRNLQLACYGISVAPSYPSNCRDIIDPGLRDFCYSVSSWGVSGSCSRVVSSVNRRLCQALTYRDSSYCAGIPNTKDRLFCYGVTTHDDSYCTAISSCPDPDQAVACANQGGTWDSTYCTCFLPGPPPPNPFAYFSARDQYLACYGISGRLSVACDDISDFNDRQMCYGMAGSTQTPCKQMIDRNLQLACYGMSVAPNYVSNCDTITDPELRDFCYSVASWGRWGSCSGVSNPETRSLCQALTYRDSSYCAGITNANDRWFCYGTSSRTTSYCESIVF
ncbi:MAG TPA: CRTAC1 family protein [Thermoanaerobaculia bacterium]|jgi:hypothetical protein|nr:CRTAC1 family protein [Thermoanaerobaculia bacterium]